VPINGVPCHRPRVRAAAPAAGRPAQKGSRMSEQARGSSKLGELSHEDLHLAIDTARTSYKIERWWKYGQPAIDQIVAVLNITAPQQAGSVLGGLANLHSSDRQVNFDVFPYGIPVIDGVRVQLRIDQIPGK